MVEAVRQPVAVTAARRSRPSAATPRLPMQVLALVGLSGGCYAASLAAVAGFQSSSETALAAARAPYAADVSSLGRGNDRLERSLSTLADADRREVDASGSAAAAIAGLEAQLDGLAASMSAIDGATRALPARAPMPPVVRSVGVPRSVAPRHATTGGSAAP